MQDATPSAEDDAKRLDVLQRLGVLLDTGLLGYSGLCVQVCAAGRLLGARLQHRPLLAHSLET